MKEECLEMTSGLHSWSSVCVHGPCTQMQVSTFYHSNLPPIV